MIRRINIYGASGVGKTQTSFTLAAYFKRGGSKVELVREEAKLWAYRKEPIRGWDQWEVSVKQLQQERFYLDRGIDFIVTDCPLLLNGFYARKYDVPNWKGIIENAILYEKDYPSYNLFLYMTDREFQTFGRYETQEESRQNQEELLEFLKEYKINFEPCNVVDIGHIQGLTWNKIRESNLNERTQ